MSKDARYAINAGPVSRVCPSTLSMSEQNPRIYYFAINNIFLEAVDYIAVGR